MTASFEEIFALPREQTIPLGKHAWVLRGFALPSLATLLPGLRQVTAQADFRHMLTPGGERMSVAMTNCGTFGWVSGPSGYRYSQRDPLSGDPWPALPASFAQLAGAAAARAAFAAFVPDACLINRYQPGTRLSLHQDRDETDFAAPIVSVSLGMAAVFLFGGLRRTDRAVRVPLLHGDVVVWGGEDRLRFHGVLPLGHDAHELLGAQRLNLTFRKAG